MRYYEFYLSGLRSVIGKSARVRPSSGGMPDIRDPKSGMAAILPDGMRLFIAANDGADVDEDALAWCDVYGKVNLAHEDVGRDRRLVAIGPGFGIPCATRASLVRLTLETSLRSRPMEAPARLRAYWDFQSSRAPLAAYVPASSDPDYLFLLASFWSRHPEVNPPRLRLFERATSMPRLTVEGGFWADEGLPAEYRRFALEAPVAHRRYLELTQRSVAALNTAAVHDCLGWKLGEYFALGKAIVTPPLTRAMPGELVHGRHMHVTDGSPEAAVEAIEQLRRDPGYRRLLELSARRYWDEYLAPESVIRRMVEHARTC